jgi:benzodiazapine receptor
MKKIDFSKLVPSLIFPLVVGISGTFLTVERITGYYLTLVKPPLNPPNWVFGPVWTFLYITLGIALYVFWNSPKKATLKEKGHLFFILQLICNFLWSMIFFNLQSPLGAALDIGLMIVLTCITMHYFNKINRTSALIMIPYLLWTCFAAYLNIGILILNP